MQRIAVCGYIACFGGVVIGSLLLGQRASESDWWSPIVVFAAVVPAAAIAMSWWIMADANVAETESERERRATLSRRVAISLVFGMYLFGRELDRRVQSPLTIAVVIWWLVAMLVLLFVIPRLVGRRPAPDAHFHA